MLTGIEDISVKSNLSKVLVKVEEKFRLDLPGWCVYWLVAFTSV